jgi:hypothetical protein
LKSFTKISWLDFPKIYYQNIREEISSKGKDYILNVDETEFTDYLIEKYRIEPLKIFFDSEDISPPIKSQKRMDNGWGEQYLADTYSFKIKYNFDGKADLFAVKPNPFTYSTYDIDVNLVKNTVSFSITIYQQDATVFNKAKLDAYSEAFTNLNKVNDNVAQFNSDYESVVTSIFKEAKNKYLEENAFFSAINVKVNKSTESIFTTPTIKKRIITQPKATKNKEFSSVPTMSKEMYDDVLKVIYDSGKSMEKKPALYTGKDEEGLRDQFLFVLETRYEGTTATGETFNRGGKADIILKYASDGSNLFIAECKVWHGSSEFLKAISQLFDRYLTWRDSKVAVMLFVKNKDISNVLSTIKNDISKHEYYLKYKSDRGESSFSYDFHLPSDKNKKVELEVMTFHFDKE